MWQFPQDIPKFLADQNEVVPVLFVEMLQKLAANRRTYPREQRSPVAATQYCFMLALMKKMLATLTLPDEIRKLLEQTAEALAQRVEMIAGEPGTMPGIFKVTGEN